MSKKKDWRASRDYRLWRAKVIRRDKRCQVCGTIKHRQAHHMNHATYFPDQRFDLENGICLCTKCHMIFHTSFKKSYRQKCTKNDMKQFFELLSRFTKNEVTTNEHLDTWNTWLEKLKKESNES